MTFEFSNSIQRSIIYLAKTDFDFFSQITTMVKPEYFESTVHSAMYSCICGYYNSKKVLPTDAIIFNEVANNKNRISVEDEIELINSIEVDAMSHKEYYIDCIEKFAKEQAMKLAITESIDHLKHGEFGKIEALIKKALTVNRNVDTGCSYFKDYKRRWMDNSSNATRDLFATPFRTINKALDGGLSAGEIYLVAAPPGVGKSIAMVNQGVTSLKEGRKVLHITLEMSEEKTAKRYDTALTLLPSNHINKDFQEADSRLNIMSTKYGEDSLVIKRFPAYTINVNNIRALLVNLRNFNSFVPNVIIIDYLELMNCSIEGLPEHKGQERLVHELRNIGIEFNAMVASCTQTNREGRKVQVITDAEFADSYGKIRAVDLAFSLNQTQEEKDNEVMRGYIIKAREGQGGILFAIDISYATLVMGEKRNAFAKVDTSTVN
jgi:replicative DNA helicase